MHLKIGKQILQTGSSSRSGAAIRWSDFKSQVTALMGEWEVVVVHAPNNRGVWSGITGVAVVGGKISYKKNKHNKRARRANGTARCANNFPGIIIY